MTVENIDLKTVASSRAGWSGYVFKFLWSPLMDRYTHLTQVVVAVGYSLSQLLLQRRLRRWAFLNPYQQLRWMAALGVVIACGSASQDIVFDAGKPMFYPQKNAAVSVNGYRFGNAGFGGLALYGWPIAGSAGRGCTG